MKAKYQLVFLGGENRFIAEIKESFLKRLKELGIKDEHIVFIDHANFDKYVGNAPSYCLYFGNQKGNFRNLKELELLLKDATIVLPIVEDLKAFTKFIPENLRKINGFELSSSEDVERLISSVLEGLSLLRLSRRLFISYKRDESSAIAIQLYERLEKAGFDVFLDTHSIRPGEDFQEELWHRLADTDVVVLLDTPGFLESNWTKEELAMANLMSIGILQLIWPDREQEAESKLSIPMPLLDSHFKNRNFKSKKNVLTDSTINKIISSVESLRARTLAARHDNIIAEFCSSSNKLGATITLQPEKFIILTRKGRKEVIIIPTVGVPQAFTYHQSEELVKRVKKTNIKEIYLLYDQRNIRERWIKHLAWLDQYLSVKTIKLTEIEDKISAFLSNDGRQKKFK